jgi:hypothetical protein
MKLFLMFPHALALAAVVVAATPSAAQVGSSFAVVASPVAPDREQVARANSAFLKFDAQPVKAVTLAEAIPDAVASHV